MFLEGVGGVGHRADAALRIVGVTLVDMPLCYDCNAPFFSSFERKAEACRAGADNQKITFHLGV